VPNSHATSPGTASKSCSTSSEGRGIGEALEAYVASRNADLLVMGAYGHSRVREFILGGATRSVLARPPVPVFLAH
jgi:nucleotide-binding universal stress UspA family protein